MIVSIHQPAYLPWLGYFAKLQASDLHIVLDDVQMTRGFVNRNKIKTPKGWQWLTVPVENGRKPIREVKVLPNWEPDHWQTLRHNYARAPFFDQYKDFFEAYFEADLDVSLHHICWVLRNLLMGMLKIDVRCMPASWFKIETKSSQRILDLCREVGAGFYLSGKHGREYLDEQAFKEAGVIILYQDYQHPTYPQLWGEFEPYMSVVDLLFNCGPESLDILMSGHHVA